MYLSNFNWQGGNKMPSNNSDNEKTKTYKVQNGQRRKKQTGKRAVNTNHSKARRPEVKKKSNGKREKREKSRINILN